MNESNVFELVKKLQKSAPKYLDLLSAETEDDFNIAFDSFLEDGIIYLEENKKNHKNLDEEGLSAALAGKVSLPGLTVTQERNSNGHVDITFSLDYVFPARKKLAEAKIWRGAEYHIQGLEQLLKRYTTGRESRGIVISYVQQRKIKDLFEKLKNRMNEEKPCEQITECQQHTMKWSFISKHNHSSGENIEVCHIGCNLFVESELGELV
ncbi:MAG: hypothetical protein KA146_01080 [Leptospiraceae bacterium]|nr:hypothetical protein [Leptospiraceae bacterium]